MNKFLKLAFFFLVLIFAFGLTKTVNAEVRYMRNNTVIVNTKTGYELGLAPTALAVSVTPPLVTGDLNVSWGIRIFKISSAGAELEITGGAPDAIVTRFAGTGAGANMQNATLTPPVTALTATDSILVRAYVRFGSGAWSQQAQFTTPQLNASQLNNTTWTVYYRTMRQVLAGSTITSFSFGGAAPFDSRIDGFAYTQVGQPQITMGALPGSATIGTPFPVTLTYNHTTGASGQIHLRWIDSDFNLSGVAGWACDNGNVAYKNPPWTFATFGGVNYEGIECSNLPIGTTVTFTLTPLVAGINKPLYRRGTVMNLDYDCGGGRSDYGRDPFSGKCSPNCDSWTLIPSSPVDWPVCDYSTSNITVNAVSVCSALSYPLGRWQRVWYAHSTGACLGDTPDQVAPTFDDNWALGAPAYGRIDDIEFRSSRAINFPVAGDYTFTLGSDDGTRLWIDNVLRIDRWIDKGYTTDSFILNLTAGNHNLRIDFYENGGDARVSFNYIVVVNNVPNATAVNDAPDPVNVGANIAFNGNWAEPDAGDQDKMYVCKDAACTNCNNASQANCWCYSGAFNTQPDTADSCNYTALAADVGVKNYWLGVCDDQPSCDATPLAGGTFTVNAACTTRNPTITIANTPQAGIAGINAMKTYPVTAVNQDTVGCPASQIDLNVVTCPAGGWTCTLDIPSFPAVPPGGGPASAVTTNLRVTNPITAGVGAFTATVKATNGASGKESVIPLPIATYNLGAAGNNVPDATSVSHAPDPVMVGANITFTGNWIEADAGDQDKMYVCKDAACTNCNTVSTANCWCSSGWNTQPDMNDSCTYPAQFSDIGPNPYWLGVCDDAPQCDGTPLAGGSFNVDPACTRASPSISIANNPQTAGDAGDELIYPVTITNNDSVGCSWTQIDLQAAACPIAPPGWNCRFDITSFFNVPPFPAPGATITTNYKMTSPGLTGAGSWTSRIQAISTSTDGPLGSGWKNVTYTIVAPPKEDICNNGADEDGDLLIDCDDPDCVRIPPAPACQTGDVTCCQCPPNACQDLLDSIVPLSGQKCGDAAYDPSYDLNKDGRINLIDVSQVANQCGDGPLCQSWINANDPCFFIKIEPPSETVEEGVVVNPTLTTTILGGGQVNLSCHTPNPLIICSFPGGNTFFATNVQNINITPNVGPGTYPIKIIAERFPLKKEVTFNLIVVGPFDFKLAFSPPSRTISQGKAVFPKLNVELVSGIPKVVNFSVPADCGAGAANCPIGPCCRVRASCTPSCTSYLIINSTAFAPGEYFIPVTGTSAGPIIKTATFKLVVEPLIAPPPTSGCVTDVDIMIAIDATGSMRDEIEGAQNAANEIIANLKKGLPGSVISFGLMSFRDYVNTTDPPGCLDYPIKLHVPLTTDTDEFTKALFNLSAKCGGDFPESYSRVLYHSYTCGSPACDPVMCPEGCIGWTSGARARFLIMIGDNLPHDIALAEKTYVEAPPYYQPPLWDPIANRDTNNILAAMDGNNITLIYLDASAGAYLAQWNGLAAQTTNGRAYSYLYSNLAKQISDIVLEDVYDKDNDGYVDMACPCEPGNLPDVPGITGCYDCDDTLGSGPGIQHQCFYGGLVPCGRLIDNPDTRINETAPCGVCHLFVLAKRIIDFLTINIVLPIGVLMFVVGGVLFLIGGGDPGKIGQAKKILTSAIFGVVIISVAWLTVNMVVFFATEGSIPGPGQIAEILGSPWSTINCPVPPCDSNGICNTGIGEDSSNCLTDCPCDFDGGCEAADGEIAGACSDCNICVVNGFCEASDGENSTNCPADCP